jgi:RNA polymerase sigma factor (sigma-70 family)
MRKVRRPSGRPPTLRPAEPSTPDVLCTRQSDERLVALARAGHEAAFEAIVERYRTQLLVCARRLNSDGRAEDFVQQAFLEAFAALRSGTEVIHLRGWLHQILRNVVISGYTRHRPVDRLAAGEAMTGALADAAEQRMLAKTALGLLADLPARQRDAFVATAIHGRSRSEVASSMGLSEAAVRQLVHRARSRLRARWRAAISVLTPYPVAQWLASARSGATAPQRAAELAAGTGVASAGAVAVKVGAVVTAGIVAAALVTHAQRAAHPRSPLAPNLAARATQPRRHARTTRHAAKPVAQGTARAGGVLVSTVAWRSATAGDATAGSRAALERRSHSAGLPGGPRAASRHNGAAAGGAARTLPRTATGRPRRRRRSHGDTQVAGFGAPAPIAPAVKPSAAVQPDASTVRIEIDSKAARHLATGGESHARGRVSQRGLAHGHRGHPSDSVVGAARVWRGSHGDGGGRRHARAAHSHGGLGHVGVGAGRSGAAGLGHAHGGVGHSGVRAGRSHGGVGHSGVRAARSHGGVGHSGGGAGHSHAASARSGGGAGHSHGGVGHSGGGAGHSHAASAHSGGGAGQLSAGLAHSGVGAGHSHAGAAHSHAGAAHSNAGAGGFHSGTDYSGGSPAPSAFVANVGLPARRGRGGGQAVVGSNNAGRHGGSLRLARQQSAQANPSAASDAAVANGAPARHGRGANRAPAPGSESSLTSGAAAPGSDPSVASGASSPTASATAPPASDALDSGTPSEKGGKGNNGGSNGAQAGYDSSLTSAATQESTVASSAETALSAAGSAPGS